MSLVVAKSIENGDVDTIRELISKKMNVNQRGPTDYRLIDFALEYDQFEIFKMLVENGAETERLDESGKNIMHKAILTNKFEYTSFMVNGGHIDVNSTDSDGNTGLHISARTNYMACVNLLMKNKVNISLKNSDGKTALEVAASFPFNDIVRVIAGGKSSSEEREIQNLFLENDLNLEKLLSDASETIHNLKSKLSNNVSDNVFKAQIESLTSNNLLLSKSLKLKNGIIDKLKIKNLNLQESLLKEKLENN